MGLQREFEFGEDERPRWASSDYDETLDEKELAQRDWANQLEANRLERLEEMDDVIQDYQIRDPPGRTKVDQEKPDQKKDPYTILLSEEVDSNEERSRQKRLEAEDEERGRQERIEAEDEARDLLENRYGMQEKELWHRFKSEQEQALSEFDEDEEIYPQGLDQERVKELKLRHQSRLEETRRWREEQERSESELRHQGEGAQQKQLETVRRPTDAALAPGEPNQGTEQDSQLRERDPAEEEAGAESADEELPRAEQSSPQTEQLHLLHAIQKHHQLQRFRHLHLELLAHPILIARTVPDFLPNDHEPTCAPPLWSPQVSTTIVPYTPSTTSQLSPPSQPIATRLLSTPLFRLSNIIPLAGAVITLVFGVFAALSYNLSTAANRYAEKSLHQTLIQNEIALLAFCWASNTGNSTDGGVTVSAMCSRVLAAATSVLPGAAADVFTTADATAGPAWSSLTAAGAGNEKLAAAVNATRSTSGATALSIDERIGYLFVVAAVWMVVLVRQA